MKLGDIYKHKQNDSIIQIDSFATPINGFVSKDNFLIIFRRIEKHNEFEIGSNPSSNGYGTIEEIKKEYELFIPQEELINYSDWNEIFSLIE